MNRRRQEQLRRHAEADQSRADLGGVKEYTLVYKANCLIAHLKVGDGESMADALSRIGKTYDDVVIFEGRHDRILTGDT